MKRLPSILLLLSPVVLAFTGADAAIPVYRNAVLGDGAIAYYEFDEISGSTAADSAITLGGVNNGSILGNVALNQPGGLAGLNSAYGFSGADGTSGRVRILDHPAFDFGTGAFTIEMWYKTPNVARGDLFTYKGAGGDFGIHSNSQGAPGGFDSGVSVYFNAFETFNSVGANSNLWHHVALTRSGTGSMLIYIDGNLMGAATDGDSMNIASDLLIGSNHTGDPSNPTLNYTGLIDEVAIYGSALTEAQIDNHIALASVPEPAAAGMLLLGAVSLVARRRARR